MMSSHFPQELRLDSSLRLDFAAGGNEYSLLKIEGISTPETWRGVWSDARMLRTCMLHFLTPLPTDFQCTIVAKAFGNNSQNGIKLRIGAIVKYLELTPEGTQISFPVSLDDPVTIIEFIPAYTAAPNDLGLSNDNRKLSIGLHSIELIPNL